MAKPLEINVRVFPDRGSVLVSIDGGLLATPGAVIELLRQSIQAMQQQYPETMTREEGEMSQYLLSNENPQRQ